MWKSVRFLRFTVISSILVLGMGCAANKTAETTKEERFVTSGSPEADQRARQTVDQANKREEAAQEARKNEEKVQAKADERSDEKQEPRREAQRNESDTRSTSNDGQSRQTANTAVGEAPVKKTLYERLGGEKAIRAIVNDFLKRALEDPRVNWTRTGVKEKGLLRSTKAREWEQTPENVNRMKEHFVQFLSLAAGGPTQYGGRPIKPLHAEMQITKAEFDASIGDLKATLDNLKITDDLQKELLAIFESTRPQIVTER